MAPNLKTTRGQLMATIAALPSMLISLADVARLAQVQRPAVSMWRSRSAASDSPFPELIERAGAQERFDAEQVVSWLELTGKGNNPDVRADVAAFASLAGVSSLEDAALFAGLTALLALKAVSGEQLGGRDAGALLDLADDVDPDDSFLLREVAALGEDRSALALHVDGLSDAAFSPAGAFERLMSDRFRRHLPGHAVVALRDEATALVAHVARALAVDADIAPGLFVDPTCGGSDLLVTTVGLFDDESAPSVMTTAEDAPVCRLAQRRLRVHDIHREDLHVDDEGAFELSVPAVLVAHLPAPGSPSMSVEAMLSAIDNIAIQMDDDQRAVVIAPAAVLSDRLLDPACEQLRDSVLRLGRVRAVVRLPKGLVTARPRQQLAMWVLGPSYADVPADERWMMLADLANVPLAADVIDDLVTDLVASMGDEAMVRAHAFRFTRLVKTRILLATRGNLVEVASRVERAHSGSAAELAVRIAILKGQLRDGRDVGQFEFDIAPDPDVDNLTMADHITVGRALAAGSLQVIAGNRLDPADLHGGSGARVIGPAELAGSSPLGERQVDRLRFGASYDAGRYTEAGDVVFCTSPRVAAMVDEHGGSVVVSPARVLRVDRHQAQGLLPRVLAADINSVVPQAKQWRLWRLRRAPAEQWALLRETLEAIDAERVAALDRVSQLDELAALVTAGVTDTTLTITPQPREEGRCASEEEGRRTAVDDEGAQGHAMEGRGQAARVDGRLAVQGRDPGAGVPEVRLGRLR
jgi:hypothetical protein